MVAPLVGLAGLGLSELGGEVAIEALLDKLGVTKAAREGDPSAKVEAPDSAPFIAEQLRRAGFPEDAVAGVLSGTISGKQLAKRLKDIQTEAPGTEGITKALQDSDVRKAKAAGVPKQLEFNPEIPEVPEAAKREAAKKARQRGADAVERVAQAAEEGRFSDEFVEQIARNFGIDDQKQIKNLQKVGNAIVAEGVSAEKVGEIVSTLDTGATPKTASEKAVKDFLAKEADKILSQAVGQQERAAKQTTKAFQSAGRDVEGVLPSDTEGFFKRQSVRPPKGLPNKLPPVPSASEVEADQIKKLGGIPEGKPIGGLPKMEVAIKDADALIDQGIDRNEAIFRSIEKHGIRGADDQIQLEKVVKQQPEVKPKPKSIQDIRDISAKQSLPEEASGAIERFEREATKGAAEEAVEQTGEAAAKTGKQIAKEVVEVGDDVLKEIADPKTRKATSKLFKTISSAAKTGMKVGGGVAAISSGLALAGWYLTSDKEGKSKGDIAREQAQFLKDNNVDIKKAQQQKILKDLESLKKQMRRDKLMDFSDLENAARDLGR